MLIGLKTLRKWQVSKKETFDCRLDIAWKGGMKVQIPIKCYTVTLHQISTEVLLCILLTQPNHLQGGRCDIHVGGGQLSVAYVLERSLVTSLCSNSHDNSDIPSIVF